MLEIRLFPISAVIADSTFCFTFFVDPFHQIDTVGMKARTGMTGMCFHSYASLILTAFNPTLRTDFDNPTFSSFFQLQLLLITDQLQYLIKIISLLFIFYLCTKRYFHQIPPCLTVQKRTEILSSF